MGRKVNREKNKGFLLLEPENISFERMPIESPSLTQKKTRPQGSHVPSRLDEFTCSHFTDFNKAWV